MSAADSPQVSPISSSYQREGRLSQVETSMVQRQRNSVQEANNAKSEAENVFGDYCFIMRAKCCRGCSIRAAPMGNQVQ